MFSFFKKEGKIKDVSTIAFYNIENLFDTVDDPKTLDDDFTPKGIKHWNKKRYKNKIHKLSNVISQIGTEKSHYPPAILGLVEVENSTVLDDLLQSKHLKNHPYAYAHFDSPDERGIDVALLYHKQQFKFIDAKTYPIFLVETNGLRDYTRDILLVKGKLNGELIYVLVNHWPSRRSGDDETEFKRIQASNKLVSIVETITFLDENAKLIIMGDFNDDPTSKSISNLIKKGFYNPMQRLLDTGKGSLNHQHEWHIFDQILISKNFLEENKNGYRFKYAEVFDRHFLREWSGKFKGNPFRTYSGKKYLGGASDHFPVYIYLQKQ
ncbi:MAG TPA: endonuclease/exonuclease/phosphatase family protein [Flavobacteriaceae bacterium]|nr:endonuclease/exonuclease/phosphatase family protein [Flavobacteriaceae bacterium]